MRQPELGLKVAELRLSKGFTQEHLAELCEVSTRTVQRIESGEVDPRTFTLNNLGKALSYQFSDTDSENEPLWLAALHLSSTVCFILIPILIWSWKKEISKNIKQQGIKVLNFQITVLLILVASSCFTAFIPLIILYTNNPAININIKFAVAQFYIICLNLPLFTLGLFTFYQGIANTIRSINGQEIKYALSIKFLK